MTEDLKLDVVRESDFLIEESDNDIFITGTTFSMPKVDPNTWGLKNLHIQAFELTLTSDINCHGKNISINTNTLRTNLPLKIDVSGLDGTSISLPANNGRTLGVDGASGSEGRSGRNSGNITLNCQTFHGVTLSLIAKGGNGSRGQKGGDGQRGATGSNARDSNLSKVGSEWGKPGGTGGKGGNGGQGGKGGNGGNGGIISLELGSNVDINLIVSDIEGGLGGQPGDNGKAGAGGPGGKGGLGRECFSEHDSRGAERF